MTGEKKGEIAAMWLTNPVFVWGAVILMAYVALKFVVPGLYGGAKDAGKKLFGDLNEGFSDVVDAGQANLSSIVGAGTNLPNKGALNEVRQTIAPGGRGLSDIADWFGLGS